MAKNRGLIIGGIVAAAALLVGFIGKKAGDTARLRFNFSGVSLKFDGIRPILNLKFALGNPSTSSYTVQALAGDVYLNGSNIGQVQSYDPVIINPLGITNVTLTLKLSLLGAIEQINKVINKEIAGKVEFRGAVTVAGVSIPVNVSQNII